MLGCFALMALVACSGMGPGANAPGGSGSPDSASAAGPVGQGQANAVAAAQPLSGGFPAPSLEGDPGKNIFSVNFEEQDPVCREDEADRYGYVFSGYVAPPGMKQPVNGMVLRWIDPVAKTYLDVELEDNGGFVQQTAIIILNYTGHFRVEWSGSYPAGFRAALLPATAAKDKLNQVLPCPDEACVPPDVYKVEVNSLANLDASALANLPTCLMWRAQYHSVVPQRKIR